jgi:hypothetical protein
MAAQRFVVVIVHGGAAGCSLSFDSQLPQIEKAAPPQVKAEMNFRTPNHDR